MASEWASLPVELLDLILDGLVPMEDYFGFSEVCVQWKRATCKKLEDLRSNHRRHCRQHEQVPLLLYANPSTNPRVWPFLLFDIIKGRIVLRFEFQSGCWRMEGSSHGWLITIDIRTSKVSLYNPLSKKFIRLPALNKSIRCRKQFGVLSMDPNMNNNLDETVFMVTDNGPKEMKTAFTKLGRGKKTDDWTYVEDLDHLLGSSITHINGIFYLNPKGFALYSCRVNDGGGGGGGYGYDYELRDCVTPSPLCLNLGPVCSNQYLVESPEGELFRIETHESYNKPYKYVVFVHKFIWFTRSPRWEEVKDLGDVALFLGHSHSVSVVASDFPGCRPNSIYFCFERFPILCPTTYKGSAYVYSLQHGTFERLYPNYGAPIFWFTPSPSDQEATSF